MMIRLGITTAIFLVAAPGVPQAQTPGLDIGRQEYMVACAGCHGETGKGNGPLAGLLNIETPDLTTITRRMEQETFPYRNTLLLIDGRNGIRAHGGEMPIWGDRLQAYATAVHGDAAMQADAELIALGRMLAVTYYLESIQE